VINGTRPILLGSGSIQSFSSRFEFTNDTLSTPTARSSARPSWLRLDRTIADGVHEDYDLENFAPSTGPPSRSRSPSCRTSPTSFDVKRAEIVRRGQLNTRWFRSRGELRSTYRNRDFRRDLVVAVERAGDDSTVRQRRLVSDVTLPPKAAGTAASSGCRSPSRIAG
jgi:hypothetical protein